MQKILVFWRDIPAQVLVKRGRDRGKAILSQRFQEAIDRAAMRAGRGSSNAYLEDWRRESRKCGGDLEKEVSKEVARLEELFPQDVLEITVKAGGKTTADGDQ